MIRLENSLDPGYEVETHADHEVYEPSILTLHQRKLEEAAAYSERLRNKKPTLPIVLLLDTGVFVPHGTLSESIETGFPAEMVRQIAEMLAGCIHIRERHFPGQTAWRESATP